MTNIVKCGQDYTGEDCTFYLDGFLQENLSEVKEVVTKKDWDYVSMVVGNPGVGKSTFAQSLAKYCCHWFNEKFIAFTADEFVRITNSCPKNSSIILDESFASLNNRVTMSSDFVKIINHLQLIRQKNLFIFLCLPNFFDLAKGVAIYRSHHLFVCYSQSFGKRGTFVAFARENKKRLYILGSKYMDYNVVKGNFHGKFFKHNIINQDEYDERKKQHLQEQDKVKEKKSKYLDQRNKLILLYLNEGKDIDELADILKVSSRQIYRIKEKIVEETIVEEKISEKDEDILKQMFEKQ